MEIHYVGYSSRLESRRKKHLSLHPKERLITLGIYPTREHALRKEAQWIARLFDLGFPLRNISAGGTGGFTDRRVSNLTRAQQSIAIRKAMVSPEIRAKVSMAMKGNKNGLGHRHSLEARARMSASKKGRGLGRTLTTETRAKISAALKGRRLSVEHVANAAAAHRNPSPETRAKIAAAARNISQATRSKRSVSVKASWAVRRMS